MSVELVQVRKRYGAAEVLRGVSFHARAGEVVGLLGPNGAGKTTTLRVAAGLTRPTGGQVRVCGWDVAAHPQRVRRCVGVVLEQAGTYGRLSAVETLRYFGALYGLDPEEVERRTDELVRWLGMESFCRKPTSTYSRGMRQRLHLARALLHDPAVLLLDEPTSGLDAPTVRAVRDVVRSLAKDGRCVLVATCSPSEARQLCDRVVLLRDGRVWAEAAAEELAAEGTRG